MSDLSDDGRELADALRDSDDPDGDFLFAMADGRGRGAQAPLHIDYVRDLTEADVALLSAAPPARAVSVADRLTKLHHRHHLAARMIADGAANAEVAYATNYDVGYVSALKGDPAFAQLVAHYGERKEEVWLDVHQRLGTLAMSAVDAMQERLDDPERAKALPFKELREVAAMALERSIAPTRGAGRFGAVDVGGGLVVNLNFAEPPAAHGQVVDVTPIASDGGK